MSTSASSLTNDPLLAPFTSPTFSPITYLNSTLPSPPPPTTSTKTPLPSLATLSSQTQSQISTLSAQTARLSTTLTALTDDILRCSSRLAYEVELLRGEALGLVESLDLDNASSKDDSLAAAMRRLMPPSPPTSSEEGALQPKTDSQTPTTPSKGALPRDIAGGGEEGREEEHQEEGKQATTPQKALSQLHTLLHVRTLLTSTTQTFNAALSFPLPPSLLSSTSSFISIVPPALPTSHKSTTNNHPHPKQDEEERAQEALHSLQQELEALAAGEDGEMKAKERIRELREVVTVWKGTGEEKARGRVVDALEGVVEQVDRRRREEESIRSQGQVQGRRPAIVETRAQDAGAGGGGGGGGGRGFLEGLQRLRGEMGMD